MIEAFGFLAAATTTAMSQPYELPKPPEPPSYELRPVADVLVTLINFAFGRGKKVIGVRMNYDTYKRLAMADNALPQYIRKGPDNIRVFGYPVTIDRNTILRVETETWHPPRRLRSYTVPRFSAGAITSQLPLPLTTSSGEPLVPSSSPQE